MIDTRFPPARSIGVDREGRHVVHVSLKRDFIGVILQDQPSPPPPPPASPSKATIFPL
ncbi:MAG: hypothetical protein NTX09_18320 [Verrucomicrobia bacterium]|nr:hypothetical protein [Verrucomicrobiota bacterium]